MPTYEEIYTAEAIAELAKQGQPVPAKEDMTCLVCADRFDCPYAWDLYNTDGDCLADK